MRGKRRNWLALQSQMKHFREQYCPSAEDKARIDRKLQHHHDKYQAMKASRSPPWVPTQKMPRLLTSSPSACRRLIKKAELLGINTQTLQVQQSASDNVVDIRRKWHVPPAFSVEFVSYYLDRGERMISMQTRLSELLSQNTKLQEEEKLLRDRFDKLTEESDSSKAVNGEMHNASMALWKILNALSNRTFSLPEVLKPKKSPQKPARTGRRTYSDISVTLNQCGICKKTQDQHLLAKCDTCQLYYHLGCLDPPLSRMPKKTKQQGWQCSECDKTDNDEKEEEVDPDAPRKLREHIKEPVKFTPPSLSPALKKNSKFRFKRRTLENRRSSKRKAEEMMEDDSNDKKESSDEKEKNTSSSSGEKNGESAEKEVLNDAPSAKRLSTSSSKLKTKDKDVKVECCKCSKGGENTNSVKCDECFRCFHFLCLNPPVKKSPKQRGYTWHCENCDPSESPVS